MSLKCKSEDTKYKFSKVILRIQNVSYSYAPAVLSNKMLNAFP